VWDSVIPTTGYSNEGDWSVSWMSPGSSKIFVIVRIMDRPGDYCASLPRERSITADTPHLVAPVYLEDLRAALRTRTGILLDGSNRGYIVGITDMRHVYVSGLGFMTVGAGVLVAHTTLPLSGHISTASVVDTWMDC
jgi:hypothetical protein